MDLLLYRGASQVQGALCLDEEVSSQFPAWPLPKPPDSAHKAIKNDTQFQTFKDCMRFYAPSYTNHVDCEP